MTRSKWLFVLVGLVFLSFAKQKSTLYIIGDSTVKNGDGTGKNSLWGWATVIDPYFDTTRISVENHAIGGRSSRTFITEGRWEKILQRLHKGDYVLIQFGHNDASPLDDTARARGTIRGIGNDSIDTYNPIRKQREVVYSYGWYMRRYVREIKEKQAIPIICSLVPRDNWKEGKVKREDYALWAKEIAEETGAYFIPLNEMIAVEYEKMDTAKVHALFPSDHTHTNKAGAEINAAKVVEGIKDLNKCKLKKYLVN